MGVNTLVLLLLWSNIVDKCMGGCAIDPVENGNVTIPDDLGNGANRTISFLPFGTWEEKRSKGTSIGLCFRLTKEISQIHQKLSHSLCILTLI